MTTEHQVLAPAEVGELLHCSVETVEERARSGELPGLQFGRGWIFPADALYRRLNELALEESQARTKRKHRPKAVPEAPRPKAILRTVPRRKGAMPPPLLPTLPELP